MLELDEKTKSQLGSLKTIKLGLPFDTVTLENGTKTLLNRAELPLTPIAIGVSKPEQPARFSNLVYKTLLDQNGCVLIRPAVAVPQTIVLAEFSTSVEILKRMARKELDLGIISSLATIGEFAGEDLDTIQRLGVVSLPGGRKTDIIKAFLVGGESLDETAFDRVLLRGLSGINRLVAKIGRASRQTEEEARSARNAIEEGKRRFPYPTTGSLIWRY